MGLDMGAIIVGLVITLVVVIIVAFHAMRGGIPRRVVVEEMDVAVPMAHEEPAAVEIRKWSLERKQYRSIQLAAYMRKAHGWRINSTECSLLFDAIARIDELSTGGGVVMTHEKECKRCSCCGQLEQGYRPIVDGLCPDPFCQRGKGK